MNWVARLALLIALVAPEAVEGQDASGRRDEDSPECTALRAGILGHKLTLENFDAFWTVASYREAEDLEILPGYPYCMKIEEAVAKLGEDAETGVRLLAGGMSPADYVITGWVIVTAYDPKRSGLRDAAEESPNAQANIAFVKARRGIVRRMFRN